MTTDELIRDLASHAAPVRPLRAPGLGAAAWCGVALASAVFGVALFGARPDIGERLRQPEFVWTLAAALGAAVSASASALVLAVPGRERTRALRRSALAIVALWGLVLLAMIVREGRGFAADWHGPVCFIRAMAVGAVPAGVLFAMIRRAAPLQPAWSGALAGVAAVASGAIAVHVACPLNDPAHTLLGHFAPVLATGWLGALAGRRWLRVNFAPVTGYHGGT